MKFYTHIRIICLTFCLLSFVAAQEVDYSGTSVANFLKIGMGARQVAMADAAIAVVDDANSLFWNPAAAARVSDFGSATISYMNWLVDTQISYISGVLNLNSFGYIGLDLQFMDYGNIEETTVYDQNGTGRFVNASDMAIGLAYSRKLTERFSFGFKAKYVAEKLAGVTADAFAFDIGADFQTSFLNNNLRLAAVVSNFGTKMKFSGRDLSVIYTVPGSPSSKQIPANLETLSWELPLLFRFGISNYFINNEDFSALLAYDILDSRDYDVRHNLGAEVGYRHTFYLRGGYKFNYDEVTYTAGIGLDLTQVLGYQLMLDYVFLDYGVFSTLHQFSFTVNF